METLPEIYLGGKYKDEPPVELRAGSLRCLYHDGVIRYIRAGQTEILRMIYPAVRDRDWGTVPGTITGIEIAKQKDAFQLRYDCRYTRNDIDFHARCNISGTKDNRIIFSIQGEARKTFLKNRIGLNVLHPVKGCAGRKCVVETPAGAQYGETFPVDICPQQPMKEIRSLQWTMADGIGALLGFSGDVFEMEDQRNWTDASYKTYSTPLHLPFPVKVPEGTSLNQEVRLEVSIPSTIRERKTAFTIERSNEAPLEEFPVLGIGKSSEVEILPEKDLLMLREAGFSHYRVDLELFGIGWQKALFDGASEALSLGLELELGLFLDHDPDQGFDVFLAALSQVWVNVARILVYTRDHLNNEELSARVVPRLKTHFPGIPTGTGTNANFAELNRHRPGMAQHDFLAFAITPQIHAFDPLSLVENLEAQRDVVTSAQLMSEGKPVSISPVTLRPRFNIVASSADGEDQPEGGLPFRIDSRQPSLFCAGWTLGSLKYLSESGVSSITYYESAGRGGVLHGDHDPVSPDLFAAERGSVFPVYYLFRELSRYRNSRVRKTTGSHPLQFSSVMLEATNEKVLVVANHTHSPVTISLPESLKWKEVWTLDEHTLPDLREGSYAGQGLRVAGQVTLNPYAVSIVKTSQ